METTKKRPPKEERDQLRRSQIGDAARQLVVRYGIHATSTAEIAAGAGLSIGQMYRYFPTKEAIVHAIVRYIVDRRIAVTLPSREDFPADFARLAQNAPLPEQREDEILMLEVSVEATRNPAVAEILRHAHEQARERLLDNLRKDFPELAPAEAAARLEVLNSLAEGMILRRAVRPDVPADAMHKAYRATVDRLLNAPPTLPGPQTGSGGKRSRR